MAKNVETEKIFINHPKASEKLNGGQYSFRVETKVQGPVEVSVDGGPWQACREAVGYHWYDWSGGTPGKHKVVAKVKDAQGKGYESRTTSFEVLGAESGAQAGGVKVALNGASDGKGSVSNEGRRR